MNAERRERRSVVVIGAGVVGLCCALQLARRGFKVTVLDRRADASGDCCSQQNAGLIVPSHVIPLAAPGALRAAAGMLMDRSAGLGIRVRPDLELLRWGRLFARSATAAHVARAAPALARLHTASRDAFVSLAEALDEFGGIGFKQRGLLMLCRSEETLSHESAAAAIARAHGVEARTMTGADAAQLEPAVDPTLAGAVCYPGDCHLDPQLLVSALTKAAVASGAAIEFGAEARRWITKGNSVCAVRSSAGEVEADTFVIAGGMASGELTRPLGLRLPIQPGRGCSVTLPACAGPALLEVPSLLCDARVAVTPLPDGRIRIGGTMEIGARESDPIEPRRVHRMLDATRGFLPGLREAIDTPALDVWSGLRPCSPDGLPFIGRIRPAPNVLLATGHGMLGVSLGPVTGAIIADLAEGHAAAHPIDLLDPHRF